MKRYAPLQAARSNAAEPTSQRKLKPLSTQNADPLQRLADQSGQVGLLQRLQAGADSHMQRTGIPAQRAATEDEDMLQGKFKAAQLAVPEEEEPLQGRFDTAQAAGLEEEEPLQGKFKTAQLATPEEEEEPLQGRFETAQAVGLEEEEPLQGKFERVTGSSEAVHRKVDPTTEVNGVPVNDDPALEHEADVMGAKAAQFVPEEEEPLQGKFGGVVQKAEAQPNQTGLPDNLKAGVENLSGMSMDNVRVHYNSSKPAQLNALAYAQGTDIHLGPGQEKHLPHEAWHVVQQTQRGNASDGVIQQERMRCRNSVETSTFKDAPSLPEGTPPLTVTVFGNEKEQLVERIVEAQLGRTYEQHDPHMIVGVNVKVDRPTEKDGNNQKSKLKIQTELDKAIEKGGLEAERLAQEIVDDSGVSPTATKVVPFSWIPPLGEYQYDVPYFEVRAKLLEEARNVPGIENSIVHMTDRDAEGQDRYATDRSKLGELVNAGSFGNKTIAAGAYAWVETKKMGSFRLALARSTAIKLITKREYAIREKLGKGGYFPEPNMFFNYSGMNFAIDRLRSKALEVQDKEQAKESEVIRGAGGFEHSVFLPGIPISKPEREMTYGELDKWLEKNLKILSNSGTEEDKIIEATKRLKIDVLDKFPQTQMVKKEGATEKLAADIVRALRGRFQV